MSIANEYTDTFYFMHFDLEGPVNATYIITFWDQWPCTLVYDIPTDKLQVKQACVHQENWWLTRYKLLIAIGGHRPKANSNAFILF